MNLAALVEYDGTRFRGFQRQSAEQGPTVQGAIEAALARIAGEVVRIQAAGRTDSGVHATGQVINFHTSARHDPPTWQRVLNALLPEEIAIRAMCQVGEDFRARQCAIARHYRYHVVCDARRAPLRERYAWRVAPPLDVSAMDAAAARLLGERDFAAFGSNPSDQRDGSYRGHTVRMMLEARCQAGALGITCDFAANAFLTGMVRRLVGTLVLVGQRRLSGEDFQGILEARARSHPGVPAPARGLCFTRVVYPPGMLVWEAAPNPA
ncbi:MAG: tRNA pseudouridine(38-40) synthase TruA [Ktedonobacterales bacterium]|nr:tRNA pseudouridine(38-40) synthase TruA [Ktedonobacterales bacterium]